MAVIEVDQRIIFTAEDDQVDYKVKIGTIRIENGSGAVAGAVTITDINDILILAEEALLDDGINHYNFESGTWVTGIKIPALPAGVSVTVFIL